MTEPHEHPAADFTSAAITASEDGRAPLTTPNNVSALEPSDTDTEAPDEAPTESLGTNQLLPILLLLFIGSGCSALIYEIVWFQSLQLVIGSSGVSLGVLLGTFMGGMCLGSLALPRLIPARWHPLRVYAFLELGIGVVGIALLFGMPFVGQLYTDNVGHGFAGILFRGVVCALCLLPPTILMGATLPAIARWMETTKEGVAKLGFFYGANIAGAVFGCLLAGFYLLRVFDLATATFVAAAINGLVAVISLVLALVAGYRVTLAKTLEERPEKVPGAWAVYVTILLSGLCALGAEVIWTRLLSLLLGATVYTFSIILSVFLIGLGIGSSIGAIVSRSVVRPRMALAWCQFCLAGAIAWTAYTLCSALPYWPVDPKMASTPWLNFQLDMARCMWAMLPAACLWGASFPLALAAVAAPGQDSGKLVGGVYAANTVGAILGALGFSLLMVGELGTQRSQQILIALSGLAALLMFVPFTPRRQSDTAVKTPPLIPAELQLVVMTVFATVLAGVLIYSIPSAPAGLIAYGRNLIVKLNNPDDPGFTVDCKYVGEGMNASVAVTELKDGTRVFHVSGKAVASSIPHDMRLQRLLGHISALAHPKPESVLVVGCGAGVTAGSFVVHPSVKRIVVCEIEPLIPPAARKYFGTHNHYVFDPGKNGDLEVEVVYDDARHFILTTNEKFDIITSDPIHPWVKGAAALYSKEYFELCTKRLKPGGVVTQWVPMYQSTEAAVKSEIATFFEVFPHGTIWANDILGRGYDLVLLGQQKPTKIDIDKLQKRLWQNDHNAVSGSLFDAGIASTIDLLATYAGQRQDLTKWLADAEINTDANLRLQYLAGNGLNLYEENKIFENIIKHYKYPRNLFTGSEENHRFLRERLEGAPNPP